MMKRDIKLFILTIVIGLSWCSMIICGAGGSIKLTLLSIFILLISTLKYRKIKDIKSYNNYNFFIDKQ